MNASEWEEVADRTATQLQADIETVESTFWPLMAERSLRDFWPQVRVLNERLRTAEAIKLDSKLELQRKLNDLCQKARQHQQEVQQRATQEREDLDARITLACEALTEEATVQRIQEIRSDLALIRARLTSDARALRRSDRQLLWERWQSANQAAWESLNRCWEENRQLLMTILEDAEHRLEAGDSRGAKDAIRTFHAKVNEHECSHQALRELRARAGEVWGKAESRGREKHEAYLEHLRRRVQSWKGAEQRNRRKLVDLASEITHLENLAGSAPTDVAAAMARGQLAERRRALADLEAAEADLVRRIASAESTLDKA